TVRSAQWTVPRGSAPTTSRRTASRTTGSGSRPTTWTRCSTVSSGLCWMRSGRPTVTRGCRPNERRRTGGAAMSRKPLRLAIIDAAQELEAAGVPDPRIDAEILAAHVAEVDRSRLGLVPLVDEEVLTRFRALVARRASRVPLQHILGTAPMGPIDVAVGPGVFTPRFETELLYAWAVAALDRWDTARAESAADSGREAGVSSGPVVLDLCTGSGALALAIAHARPDAEVHAVESETPALAWARRNADARARAGETPVRLHQGDVTDRDLLTHLEGRVDVVVANPPYVPEATEVEPEVREHDPAAAVFAGADGLDVLR